MNELHDRRGRFASAVGVPQGEEFGAEVERLRRRRGLSYDALADRAGLSRSYVREVCVGSRGHRPPRDTVEALAHGLGVEPAAFRLFRLRVLVEEHPEQLDQLFDQLYPAASSNGNGRRRQWDRRG
jgi:transcriptional regulator with XRE-family HTH domain